MRLHFSLSDRHVTSFWDRNGGRSQEALCPPGGTNCLSVQARWAHGTGDCVAKERALSEEILTVEQGVAELIASFLSVVVAAKNEAANLPQLVDEIAAALRPLCNDSLHGLSGLKSWSSMMRSTDETRIGLEELGEAYPELRGSCWPRRRAVVGNGGWNSRCARELDRDAGCRPAERPG